MLTSHVLEHLPLAQPQPMIALFRLIVVGLLDRSSVGPFKLHASRTRKDGPERKAEKVFCSRSATSKKHAAAGHFSLPGCIS